MSHSWRSRSHDALTMIGAVAALAAIFGTAPAIAQGAGQGQPRSRSQLPRPAPRSLLPPSGTYRLLVCLDSCGALDSTRAYLVGLLVVQDSTIDLADAPPSVRQHLEFASTFIRRGRSDSAPVTACFALHERGRVAHGYAGIEKASLVAWHIDSTNALLFDLYHSPDAMYEVAVRRYADTLRGIGVSRGAGVAEIHTPADSVVAWRIGPPVQEECYRIPGR